MTYEQAKEHKQFLEAQLKLAGEALDPFPRLPNGLVPDHVRATPEYREAKANCEKWFHNLRSFNTMFVKTFRKEYAADRKKRYVHD